MKKRALKLVLIVMMAAVFMPPILTLAAPKPFYYVGWLPFWKKESGTADISQNFEKLKEVSPFSYEVSSDGTLRDKLKINEGLWPEWLKAARAAKVKIIPTIAWFRGEEIHNLLSNKRLRLAHEDAIAKLVKDHKFDGIDIDYEAKKAETSPYFSLLIQGLAIRLHPKNKILACTIESRTPAASLHDTTVDETQYANDYVVLNRYCDEVRVMAYDQGTIDLKLDTSKGNGNLYAPVADPDWAEKVIKEAIKTISRKKIMLGVPTYGYEYEVGWNDGVTTYRRLRSVNFFTAMDLAEAINISPTRNNAGEIGFTYVTSTFFEVSPVLKWEVSSTLPQNFPSATLNTTSSVARFVSFTDAEAVRQKIKLAKKYGLKGVALFKLDGEADPLIWEEMK
ncbi:MAG: hypothetical protein HY093_03940 [Candidatus Liptonbacteria bacterium]|nr:hypothetical protein [Candidatus Liptonbacteria bacterium]